MAISIALILITFLIVSASMALGFFMAMKYVERISSDPDVRKTARKITKSKTPAEYIPIMTPKESLENDADGIDQIKTQIHRGASQEEDE